MEEAMRPVKLLYAATCFYMLAHPVSSSGEEPVKLPDHYAEVVLSVEGMI